MSAPGEGPDVYDLKGPGIELTYRRDSGKLDVKGDDHLLTQEDLDAPATVDPHTGLHVTATLLDSSRDGTRVMLTLMLPEVSEGARRVAVQDVTGVVVVTRSFKNRVGGPPPVLQSYDDVRRVEGTVAPAD